MMQRKEAAPLHAMHHKLHPAAPLTAPNPCSTLGLLSNIFRSGLVLKAAKPCGLIK